MAKHPMRTHASDGYGPRLHVQVEVDLPHRWCAEKSTASREWSSAVQTKITEALKKRIDLRQTGLCQLCPDDVREDATNVIEQVSKVAKGMSANIELTNATPFWLQVDNRMQWFYKYICDQKAEGTMETLCVESTVWQPGLEASHVEPRIEHRT